MAEPRRAKLSGTVTWQSGKLFDGFAIILVSLPSTHSSISLDFAPSKQVLPQAIQIPIVAGVYDQNCELFWTDDIEPPNTRYVAYFYDSNYVRIAPTGAGTLFTIAASPYALVPPTLPDPPVAAGVPSPEA